MRIKIILIILSVALFACEPDEFPQELPLIKTEDVINVTQEGAELVGEVLSLNKSQPIIEYGFIWNQREGVQDLLSKIVLPNPIKKGKISILKTEGFLNGKTYYVRMYAKTEENLIFGNEVSFVSMGSKIPVILNFEPKVGNDGDEILINGENFNSQIHINHVQIGGIDAYIVEASATRLKVILPTSSHIGKAKLLVTVDSRSSISNDSIDIIGPTLTSISSTVVYVGQSIEVHGQNLYYDRFENFVSLLKDTLNGSYGYSATITESSQTTVKILVPPVNFFGKPHVDYTLKFAAGLKKSNGLKIRIINSWNKSAQTRPLIGFKGVSSAAVNGRGYIMGGVNDQVNPAIANLEVWVFDPTSDSWSRKSDFPGSARSNAFAMPMGDLIYFGMGNLETGWQLSDIWVYNTVQDTWQYVTEFPGGGRFRPASFLLNSTIYIGYGQFSNDWWSYHIPTNQWTQQAQPPLADTDATIYGFSINGKGYLIHFPYWHESHFNEYNPLSNIWSRVNTQFDFPYSNPYRYMITQSENEAFFIYSHWAGGTGVIKFSPLTSIVFSSLQTIEVDNMDKPFSFVIDNKLYFGSDYDPNFWILTLH